MARIGDERIEFQRPGNCAGRIAVDLACDTSQLTALFAPTGWLGASLNLPANAGDIRWRLSTSGLQNSGPMASAEQYAQRSLAEVQLAGRIVFSSISTVQNPGPNRACERIVKVRLLAQYPA